VKVGDVVRLRPEKKLYPGNDQYRVGVIVDTHEGENAELYLEVHWVGADKTWWDPRELEVMSESW
tara:strand:- start:110 stop:304 length:195 start_codon:yes stop_codon:yes gene_type:complete